MSTPDLDLQQLADRLTPGKVYRWDHLRQMLQIDIATANRMVNARLVKAVNCSDHHWSWIIRADTLNVAEGKQVKSRIELMQARAHLQEQRDAQGNVAGLDKQLEALDRELADFDRAVKAALVALFGTEYKEWLNLHDASGTPLAPCQVVPGDTCKMKEVGEEAVTLCITISTKQHDLVIPYSQIQAVDGNDVFLMPKPQIDRKVIAACRRRMRELYA